MIEPHNEDILDRGREWAKAARRGEVSPAILVVAAVVGVAVLWVALRVIRFMMKIASALAAVSTLAGVVLYLFNRKRNRDNDYLGEDE